MNVIGAVGTVTIETLGKWFGVFGGVVTVAGVLFRLNNLYNHLLTTDTIMKNRLAKCDENIRRIDDDVQENQQENRDARAYIQDRLLNLENRVYRGDWERYVTKGIISQEQLTRIRQLER